VGDYIHLTVPPGRLLHAGTYTCVVTHVKSHDAYETKYILSIPALSPSATVSVAFATSTDLKWIGKGFLGHDMYPVDYRHEQNLEQRLKDSLLAANIAKSQGS
jgi:hypothetical protein